MGRPFTDVEKSRKLSEFSFGISMSPPALLIEILGIGNAITVAISVGELFRKTYFILISLLEMNRSSDCISIFDDLKRTKPPVLSSALESFARAGAPMKKRLESKVKQRGVIEFSD
jgi:hypothetical protein